MKMLRFPLGERGMEMIRNDNVRGRNMLDVLEGKPERPEWECLDIELVGAREKDAEDEGGMKEDGSLWAIYRALLRCTLSKVLNPQMLASMAAHACS